jgi:translation initiation factor IF-2
MEIKILGSSVGEVTESDINNADSFNAIIFTFGVGMHLEAINAAKSSSVQPRNHKLIHTFLKDIEDVSVQRKINNIKGI